MFLDGVVKLMNVPLCATADGDERPRRNAATTIVSALELSLTDPTEHVASHRLYI